MINTHRIHGIGIFPYIYHINQPNVGKYTIHGSVGIVVNCKCDITVTPVNPTQITHFCWIEVCNVWDLRMCIEIRHSWKY